MIATLPEVRRMTRKKAEEIVGGLSDPSKMPCHSYSIPAARCHIGAIMAKVPGSICSNCYAMKNRYRFDNVQDALERRFQTLKDPRWVEAMSILANDASGYFRWHDSGDLQDMEHLKNIVQVCRNTPHIKHWLPTREYKPRKGYPHRFGLVGQYLAEGNTFPPNLVVRLSAMRFGEKGPEKIARELGLKISGAVATDFNCPASLQGNKCGECRKCWSKAYFSITYHEH